MSQSLVRLDRLAYTTATGGRICAKTSSGTTHTKVAVTFPTNAATDYAFSGTLSAWAATGVADAAISASAWPGLSSTNATSVSGHTVTWASSALTSGTLYCFQFAGGLTTANNNTESVVGSIAVTDAPGTSGDTGYFSIGLASGAAGQGDQIVITGATVPPIFTFSLSGNTDAFASNLGLGGAVATAGRNASVATNAANGWIMWAKSFQNSGNNRGALKSTVANYYLVGTAAVGTASRNITNGTQDYGMGVTVTTNGSATATPNAAYDGASSKVGTLDPTGFQQIAKATTPTASDVLSLVERASMSTVTDAANDYADTITVVAAGLF